MSVPRQYVHDLVRASMERVLTDLEIPIDADLEKELDQWAIKLTAAIMDKVGDGKPETQQVVSAQAGEIPMSVADFDYSSRRGKLRLRLKTEGYTGNLGEMKEDAPVLVKVAGVNKDNNEDNNEDNDDPPEKHSV